MDFEGILNFFRVTLPRKFQSEEECKGLFQTMSTYKVSQIHLYIHAAQAMKLKFGGLLGSVFVTRNISIFLQLATSYTSVTWWCT